MCLDLTPQHALLSLVCLTIYIEYTLNLYKEVRNVHKTAVRGLVRVRSPRVSAGPRELCGVTLSSLTRLSPLSR